MPKRNHSFIVILLIAGILVNACTPVSTSSPTPLPPSPTATITSTQTPTATTPANTPSGEPTLIVEPTPTTEPNPTQSAVQIEQSIMDQFVSGPLYDQYIADNQIPEQAAIAFYNEYPGVGDESFAVVTMRVDPNSLTEEQKALNIPRRNYLIVRTEDGQIEFKLLPANLQLETFSKSAVEFTLSKEYQQGLQDYLNAMELEADTVTIEQTQKEVNREIYNFITITPDETKLTDLQRRYSHIFKPIDLYMEKDNNMIPCNLRIKAEQNSSNILVSLPEDWYFNGGRSQELRISATNFNGVNAQGLYLLWEKPVSDRSPNYYKDHRQIINYAIENNINEIMGQHLVWGWEPIVPEWLKSLNNDAMRNELMSHTSAMVEAFPEIDIWVAVNEPYAVYDGGNSTELFGKRFGNDYSWISQIIEAGHAINPEAIFIINQYGVEIPGTSTYISKHFNDVIKIGEHLRDNKTHIGGIGLQGHFLASDFSNYEKALSLMDNFRLNIRKLKELYGSVYITELDILINNKEEEYLQAMVYELIIKTALEEGVNVITVFGLTDKDAWKADKNPLLFDINLKPKSAYYSVLRALDK